MASTRAGAGDVRLRPLSAGDESAVRRANLLMAPDGFEFAFGLGPGADWEQYLKARGNEHSAAGLPDGRVPACFLLATMNGEVCGRASIRFQLNDFLLAEGGHIGYGVLPAFRRRGIATAILLQSLVIARAHGVDRALLTCDDNNIGSAAVIERCGGIRDATWPLELGDGGPKRRYWID
jgi:predicted acetyltransferase